ncbi:MAG: site-specific integrase [Bacteroidota bacterium]
MKPKPTNQVTTAIMLEKRMPRKDGHYPVKLRVTSERKQKFYTIRYVPEKIGDDFTEYQKFWSRKVDKSISMTEQEFKKVRKVNSLEPYKTMAIYIQTQEKEAQDTITAIKQFTFESFEDKYFAKSKDDQDVFAAIESKANALRKDAKIGTAITYECTLNSLKNFTTKDQYPFGDITVTFLKEYEKWMLAPKVITKKTKAGEEIEKTVIKSKTTVSMYLRCLKAIFNESAPEDTIYPFGKGKYIIPSWNHNKRALTQADVGKIAGYNTIEGTMEHRSRDLWLFSYLCNGINFKDIANLKYSNIKEDTIVFERAKTAKSGNEVLDITVIITRQIGRIIDTWGNKPPTSDQYIFPIIQSGMTAEDQHRTIAQLIKNTNKYMKRICADLEIPEATTYVARHSFATVLKRSGASVEFISESLGHKNIATTQNYLAGFEDEEKRKWAEKLADF